MNDEQNEHKEPEKDSEYEFSGEDYSSLYGESKAMSLWAKLKQRRILMVVLFIFLIFLFYKVVGLFTGDKTTQDKLTTVTATKTTKTTQPTTQAQQDPSKIPSLATTAPKTTTTPTLATTQQTQNINQLSQQIKSIDDQLSQVAIAIGSLNSRLNDMTTTLSTINSQLQSLGEKFSTFEEKREAGIAAQKKRTEKKVKAVPKYYVRAIIPGRAWLRMQNGSNITVTVGDRIPGHGIVRKIDAEKGVVTTSTGTVIQYGIDEE